jgi:hypothetical protein
MKTYSIPDLLVGQTYYPCSLARKYQYGKINFAEKRNNIYLADGYEAYSIRFSPNSSHSDKWATVAVKVAE